MSRNWKKIKEDPARLISYSNRAKKMRSVVGKPVKLGDGRSVSCMLMERTAVKNIQRERERESLKQHHSPVNIDTEYSDNEKTELVVKKTRKSSEDTDDKEEEPAVRSPEDSDVEDTLRAIQEEEEPVFKKGDTKG